MQFVSHKPTVVRSQWKTDYEFFPDEDIVGYRKLDYLAAMSEVQALVNRVNQGDINLYPSNSSLRIDADIESLGQEASEEEEKSRATKIASNRRARKRRSQERVQKKLLREIELYTQEELDALIQEAKNILAEQGK